MNPSKKDLYTAKRPSGLDTTDVAIQIAIESLRSDSDPVNWLQLKVNGTTLVPHASGTGGLSEFISSLNEDDVYYGALRCSVDGKTRFYHVYFVGQAVGAMKKGKASMYKSAVFSLIDAHGEVSCANGLDEFTEDYVRVNISKMAGSADILI